MPAHRPYRRFVLLCHQRSGSNALDSMLAQHPRVGLYGQLFNNSLEYRRYHRVDLHMPLYRAHPRSLDHYGPRPPWRQRLEHQLLRLVRRPHDLDGYMDDFWKSFVGSSTVPTSQSWQAAGFKLHDLQLVDDDLQRLFDRHVDRVVVLERKNLLKAAVSWAVAVQSGVWVRRGRDPQVEPVELDPRDVQWWIDKTRRELDGWRSLLASRDVPNLWLSYEEHVVERRFEPLMDFLGVEAAADLAITTRRLASPTYDHVLNARAIDEALGHVDTGFLFAGA